MGGGGGNIAAPAHKDNHLLHRKIEINLGFEKPALV